MATMALGQVLPFGALLRRYRLAARLTQEALAVRAGLSARAISDLERGVRRAPYRNTVTLLADALRLTDQERAIFEHASGRWRRPPASRSITSTSRAWPAPDPTAPPLVGRSSELELLARHLAEAGPPLLLLAGEPGIGKTRLLRETTSRARELGMTVLEDGCQRRSGQEPFAPVLGALALYIAHTARAQLRVDLKGCAWLVRLLPELSEMGLAAVPVPAWTLPLEQERRLMFTAVGRFLANVAGPAGTLLALDDLQWVGADALDLLTSLVRLAGEQPLRVLGAYRSTEVHGLHPLAVALADLTRDGLAAELPLGPLAADEAAALLAALWMDGAERRDAAASGHLQASGELIELDELSTEVLQRAGGVPYFLVSCAQAVRMANSPQAVAANAAAAGANATAADAAARKEAIPWDVAQSVRQRVAALPERGRELLAVAAVAGRVISGDVLLGVAEHLGQSRWQALEAAEACGRAGLLVELVEQDRARYSFVHDLIQEVVAADLGAGRVAGLHQEVAEALERLPGEPPIEQLAHHYARAGNQEKAVVYLEQAGDRACALHANAEALAHYQELALRLDALGDTGHAVDAARAREKLGDVLIILGRYGEALSTLDQAAHTYRTRDDMEGVASTLGRIAYAHARGGTARDWLAQANPMHEADRLAERLAATSGHASRGLASLYAMLAAAYNNAGRHAEQLHAALRGAELARALADEVILVSALVPQGLALEALGRGNEARVVFEETAELAERVGDLASSARALMSLGALCDDQGAFAAARTWHERAAEAAIRFGDAPLECLVLSTWSESAYWSGDWPGARALAERAAVAVRGVDRSYVSSCPPLMRGRLNLAEGDGEAAFTELGEAVRLAAEIGDIWVLRMGQGLLAERDLLACHPEAACERLAPLLAPPEQQDISVTWVLLLLGWAYRDLGELDRAEALAKQAVALATSQEDRRALVDALRVSALVAIRTGRRPEAAAALQEAITLAHTIAHPYAEAKALYVYGLLHQAQGEPEQAREQYEQALAICARLGERLYAGHIEQALGHLL
jgi:tetratricopeptide (TPR) repeat protein/transcriptional regulator with XRE-family HTH domain